MKTRRHKKTGGLSWRALIEEWRLWLESKRPVFGFGLKFGLLMALFYGLFLLPISVRLWASFLEANAWAANSLLHTTGQHSTLSGTVISSPQFSMAISRGCEASGPTWLFCAAVLAYPTGLKYRLVGVAVSLVFFQALNLVRIVSLYFIGSYAPSYFNLAHLDVWPMIFILAVLSLMIGWINWAKRGEDASMLRGKPDRRGG